MRREFLSILGRIHKVDFGKAMDPMSMGSGGGSPYMQDLAEKLTFIRIEMLGRMSLGDMGREWYVTWLLVRATVSLEIDADRQIKGSRAIAVHHQNVPASCFYR